MTQSNEQNHGPYLTRHELARRTRLSPATIQRLKDAGCIPFYQPGGKGGRVLFPPDAIERAQGAADDGGENGSGHRLAGPRPAWQRKGSFRS